MRFRGERQDLEEMVGNLVDNACKWAQSRVSVEVRPSAPTGDARATLVRIVVDDDGPGLTAGASAMQVARRGQPARRDQAGLGARPLDRGRSRGALRRRADAWRPRRSAGLRAELVLPAA